MKQLFTFIVLCGLTVAGCDQQKSGPVAEAPQKENDATEVSDEFPEAPDPAPSTDALYEVAGPEAAVPVAQSTDVTLRIVPAEGFKINKRFSWNFEFQSADGIEVETATVGKDAIGLEDAGASIPVKLKATSAGEHRLAATADFSVCNDTKCELYRDESVAFDIAASDSK